MRSVLLLAFALVFAPVLAAASPTSTAVEEQAVQNQEYRLGVGDQLRVIVFGEADLTGQYTIGSQGSVAFPLIGDVKAAGLTVTEFDKGLETALSQGYLKQPRVSVEVLNYRPFYILGEIAKPGTYPYASSLTVLNAVATAGGFTYRADVKKVLIKHANEEREHAYRLTESMKVQPGDTVRIPERLF